MEIGDNIVAIIAIIVTIGLPVFLGIYLGIRANNHQHEERMAMIAQGLIPPSDEKPKDKKAKSLKMACILIGIGVGMFVGFMLPKILGLSEDEQGMVMGGSILFFFGLGFLTYYFIERKQNKIENNG